MTLHSCIDDNDCCRCHWILINIGNIVHESVPISTTNDEVVVTCESDNEKLQDYCFHFIEESRTIINLQHKLWCCTHKVASAQELMVHVVTSTGKCRGKRGRKIVRQNHILTESLPKVFYRM